MPTEVVMPQMGESIAEGTIVRWIKKVGENVDRDEPLFEISTDKVDAEIPSPAAGVVSEIRAQEGETVPVNSVVAVIGGAVQAAQPRAAEAPKQAAPEPPNPSQQADGAPSARFERQAPSQPAPPPRPQAVQPPPQATPAPKQPGEQQAGAAIADRIRQRSSPLVRKIAKEHNVDISQLHGSGIAGRVTKTDILGHLGHVGQAGAPAPVEESGPVAPVREAGAGDTVRKMSVMRKRIAEHMVLSRRTSAHVHSVFEVNFSRVAQIRRARKAEFERAGTKLTYLSFIAKAVIDAIHAVPIANASVDGDNIIYHHHVNIGIAVALDWGLIVPVIKHADEKNLLGLSRAIADLANRARALEFRLLRLAELGDPGKIHLEDGVHMCRSPPAQHHVLGDLLAHHRQLFDAVFFQSWRRGL